MRYARSMAVVAILGWACGIGACGGKTEAGEPSVAVGGHAGQGGQTGQGGNAAGTGGQGGGASFSCDGDQAQSVAGVADTGFATCANGTFHRRAIATCGSGVPRNTQCEKQGSDLGPKCTTDSDCPAPYGHCDRTLQFTYIYQCECATGCIQDSDCGAGQICECGDPVGRCIEAECRSDADCGGKACELLRAGMCGLAEQYRCATAQDECSSSQQCTKGSQRCFVYNGVAKCMNMCVD
jgi:hypothetical protein